MAQHQLNAETRSIKGKQVRQLRNAGYVPAVLYGRETETVMLQCSATELSRLLGTAGTTSLVDVTIDDDELRTVLVRDVQIDPIRRTVEHVDFYQVIMTETIRTDVGIILVGEPVFQGNIFQDMTSLEIECLPQDLISIIEVDISKFIEVGESITVQDLNIPPAVTVLAPPEEVVVHTEALKELEEEIEEEELEFPELEEGEEEEISDEYAPEEEPEE
jgi:large subunit ribosomal protein L25